jgi:choline dehydrogenase
VAAKFDHIVVGGGTAGAVVAARLSEERGSQVLLLEAGPDYPDTVPRELLDASFAVTSSYNWNMQAIRGQGSLAAAGQRARISRVFERASSFLAEQHLGQPWEVSQNTSFPYLSGKVMGGGSAINGCLALHARPEDYAVWTAAGFNDWNWERIRPFISRIAMADSNKPALPVETPSPKDLTRCQKAFLDACYGLGTRWVDLQQGLIAGVGSIPKSVRKGQRVSTSALYLAAARSRENLTIQSNCLVDKLLLERSNGSLTATGVDTVVNGARTRFSGGQITVTAGAINSPALLLRSGIGSAAELVRSNVKPLLDLPGVGKNLQDHSSVSIWATPRHGSCVAGEPVHQLMLQQRSTTSQTLCDIQLYMLSAVRTHDLPGLRQMADSDLALGIAAVLATPRSRGRLEIVDDDAAKNPRIYLNCLQDPEDLRRMMEAVRSAWRIIRREPLHLHIDRFLLWTQSIIDSDALLESLIRATVRTTWHPVGTLRIGREGDPMAVVDRCGRLYGCRNVTVADASIMPAIPSVPLNLTCMLIGERIAAHLRGLEA